MTGYREKLKVGKYRKGFRKERHWLFILLTWWITKDARGDGCVRKEAEDQSAWGGKSIYDILISANEIVATSQVSVPQYY